MPVDEEELDPHGECAAEVQRLTSLLSTVRRALEPFAEYGQGAPQAFPDNAVITVGSPMARRQLTVGDVRKAASALSTLSGDMARAARGEWQPIETAPKDGTRVLVYCRAHYNDDGKAVHSYHVAWWQNLWGAGNDWFNGEFVVRATHWKALSPPLTANVLSGPHLPQHTEGRTSSGEGGSRG